MDPARFVWALLSIAVACGGKTDDSDEEGSPNVLGAKSPDESGSDTSNAPDGDTPLPGCTPGFDPDDAPDRPCDWLAGGKCYDSKIDACACVCPRRKNTTCLSDFYAPNSRTKVSCF